MNNYIPPTEQSQVSESGLRYVHKSAGTRYGHSTTFGTMSCLRCGEHKPRSLLKSTRLAGKLHYVCAGGCKKN